MFSDPQDIINEFSLDPGMVVADFGAGTGHYSFAAARAVTGAGKVYAVEIQKHLLSKLTEEAKNLKLLNIESVWGDVDEEKGSTLRDHSCDVVIIANVLFQSEKKNELFKEAHRVLKPHGRILLVDWTDSYGGLGPRPQDIVAPIEARKMLQEEGFEIVRDIHAGAHHYAISAKKK